MKFNIICTNMSSASSGIPCRHFKDYIHIVFHVVRNGTQTIILMEMQVIVGFGSRNSPCSLKHGLRSLELEFNLGDMIQFRCLFDINVGQMRELGWVLVDQSKGDFCFLV